MSPEGFDLVVDAFDLPCRDWIGGMGDDSLEMVVQQSSEPQQVLVACSHAHVHDFCDSSGHGWLIGQLVGITELLLDHQINRITTRTAYSLPKDFVPLASPVIVRRKAENRTFVK